MSDHMQEKREERGGMLCLRLIAQIVQEVGVGVFEWDRTWGIVREASDEFVKTLGRWEASGDPGQREEVRLAYDRALEAWRTAGALYARAKGITDPGGEI